MLGENATYCEKYESILNKCSMDLILLTIEYLDKEIEDISANITTIEHQFQNTLSSTEYNNLKAKTESTISEFRKTLQTRKRTKFQRDQEDYQKNQVYTWRSSGFSQPRRFPYSGHYASSNSSDSEQNPSRSSFLGPRHLPRGKRGGVRDHVPRTMTTRSQMS
ncbi:uncharacterized protein ACNLHF_019374 [Anomaloglossus baeobatrachus]